LGKIATLACSEATAGHEAWLDFGYLDDDDTLLSSRGAISVTLVSIWRVALGAHSTDREDGVSADLLLNSSQSDRIKSAPPEMRLPLD
jgi:hypothetical protein